ncbi:hypothetical protein Dimus_029831 [Dionaea muscipula]
MNICDYTGEGESEGESERPRRWMGYEIDQETGRLLIPEEHASDSEQRRNREQEECEARMNEQNLELAEIAVKLYNKAPENKDKELELVDALNSCPFMAFLVLRLAYHLNFTAKPKDGPDVETKRYFAELVDVGNGEHELTKICPVEPKANSGDEITYGCRVCHPEQEIYHPNEDFVAGYRMMTMK